VRSTELAFEVYFVADELGAGESFRRPYGGEFEDRGAVYTGMPGLWQERRCWKQRRSELLRPSRTLNATGMCAPYFAWLRSPVRRRAATPVWHISSGLLTYWDAENRAHLEKDVFVHRADQKMRAPQLELSLHANRGDKQGSGGTSQISRAVGRWRSGWKQGDRRAPPSAAYTPRRRKIPF